MNIHKTSNPARRDNRWVTQQRRMDADFHSWLAAQRGALRLNLTGHPSPQLRTLGFYEGSCLHLANCHDDSMDGRLLDILTAIPGLENGRRVIVALPTHIVLRDAISYAIMGITGYAPSIIYAHERDGATVWNRRRDMHALRSSSRTCRGNLMVI
jgi:hypothetical protein